MGNDASQSSDREDAATLFGAYRHVLFSHGIFKMLMSTSKDTISFLQTKMLPLDG